MARINREKDLALAQLKQMKAQNTKLLEQEIAMQHAWSKNQQQLQNNDGQIQFRNYQTQLQQQDSSQQRNAETSSMAGNTSHSPDSHSQGQ